MRNYTTWNREIDIVVVGLGAAGATAAITAKDSGAEVLVIEKAAKGGGNSSRSFDIMTPERRNEAIRYIQALKLRESAGQPLSRFELKLITAFVNEAMKTLPWIKSLGGEYEPPQSSGGYPPHPIAAGWKLPGHEAIREYRISGMTIRGGQSLFNLLMRNLKARNIPIMFRMRAESLVMANSSVVGLIARKSKRRIALHARRAVILACGGYEFSEKMGAAYLPAGPFHAIGATSNTGDGIRMTQAIGAKMWHMQCIVGYPGFKTAKSKYGYPIRMQTPAFFYIDKYGQRFTNETSIEAHLSWMPLAYFDPVRLEYPRIPSCVIFDDINFKAAPLCPEKSIYGLWSMDNRVELEKGWIMSAATIEDLATKIGLDSCVLVKTIERYNELCKIGFDSDFGRTGEELLPVKNPHFYAVQLWPTILNTQGGPMRNERCQILDTGGKPIPRLYSAGELGSIWGSVYPSSGNIAECLATGRIAGKNAGSEEPLRHPANLRR